MFCKAFKSKPSFVTACAKTLKPPPPVPLPSQIVVAPRNNLNLAETGLLALEIAIGCIVITRILLDAELGVIEPDNPESVKVALVTLVEVDVST